MRAIQVNGKAGCIAAYKEYASRPMVYILWDGDDAEESNAMWLTLTDDSQKGVTIFSEGDTISVYGVQGVIQGIHSTRWDGTSATSIVYKDATGEMRSIPASSMFISK